MAVAPYTVRPGTVAGGSILLHSGVTPYTVRPYRVGGPDWATQRFYFRASTVAEVSPAFDAAWTNTTGAVRRYLAPARSSADTQAAGTLQSWTAGQVRLDRQHVGPMMRGGVVLTGGLVSMVTRCHESNADDNAVGRLGVRVFDVTGTIERAVLLPVGAYGSQTEYSVSGVSSDLRIIAEDEVMAAYVTLPGDRIVVETGFTDVTGTTPAARNWHGSDQAADWPLTDATPGVNGNPWIEFRPAA